MNAIRFYFQPLMQFVTFACLMVGGAWLWFPGLSIFLGLCLLDELFEETGSESVGAPVSELPVLITVVMTIVNWLTFLLIVGASFSQYTTGALVDVSAIAPFITPQPLWAIAGGVFTMGIIGTAVCNVAHEFIHRTKSPFFLILGQWLFGFALHTSMAIEHVFGHHKNACCHDDPVSARRGEGFWRFFPRSVFGTYRNALKFETGRLSRKKRPAYSLRNRAIQGYLMQLSFFAISFLIAGVPCLVLFVASALLSQAIAEQYQYLSHYGLVRLPGTPQRINHSWDFEALASSSFTFNLTRHGNHHLFVTRPYHDLAATRETVVYPVGPNLMLIVILFPPLFRKLVANELHRWDRDFATDAERTLLSASQV